MTTATQTTKQTRMNAEIAGEIVRQLGGRKFQMMTGAKNFGFSSTDLTFKIGKNAGGVNTVKIVYDYGADLYDISFERRSFSTKTLELKIKVIEAVEGLDCEGMVASFERVTGMRTSLF